MNLRRLDLNLLVIFDALMTERHVTRAAKRVALSQPAVSNALSRLRHYLRDELFVRGPDGMLPTPRALELAPQVHAALAALESALEAPSFDPATAARSFAVETNDYIVSVVVAPLMRRLAATAPRIDVRILPAGRTYERLDAGESDFALGTYGDIPERFGRAFIDDNEFSVMMRAGHPLARGRLTLERFAAASHLLITPRGDGIGFVDSALASHGLTRRVALTVNHFTVVAPIIADTDLVVTLPRRIAEPNAARYGLVIRPSPVPIPPTYSHIHLLWHRQLGAHPAHQWFRDVLLDIVAPPRRAPGKGLAP